MSIATEIERLQTSKAAIKTAIEEKGVIVGDGTIDTYAEKIGEIESGDYDQGYEDGYDEGNSLYYASELSSVFYNVTFPENCNLTIKMQKPPTRAYQSFGLTKNLKKVKFITDDTSSPFPLSQTFRESEIEVVDFTECSRNLTDINYLFFQANGLKSILGALDLSNCTSFTYSFFAGALEDVEIVPNTIKADIRFSSSYLTDKSIQSIIDGLADLTDSDTQTLTLHGTVSAKLTDEQKVTITAKNWTLAY